MRFFHTFSKHRMNIASDSDVKCGEVPSAVAHETLPKLTSTTNESSISSSESDKEELALLDLFSGCGGMSTGLCLGAKVSSVNLVTVLYMKILFLILHTCEFNFISHVVGEVFSHVIHT